MYREFLKLLFQLPTAHLYEARFRAGTHPTVIQRTFLTKFHRSRLVALPQLFSATTPICLDYVKVFTPPSDKTKDMELAIKYEHEDEEWTEYSEDMLETPALENAEGFLDYSEGASEQNNIEKERHTCERCGLMLPTKWRLQEHHRTHTGEKPFACTDCKKRFSTYRTLKQHEAMHKEKKQHTCQWCQKSFRFRGNFTVHLRTHTGEKPYPCELCAKRFVSSGELRRHNLYHTGEKPHECGVCHKSFARLGRLRSHQLVHKTDKPYVCDQCGKAFPVPASLQSHLVVHSEEKPYLCQVCGKSFKRASTLRLHTSAHFKESTSGMSKKKGKKMKSNN